MRLLLLKERAPFPLSRSVFASGHFLSFPSCIGHAIAIRENPASTFSVNYYHSLSYQPLLSRTNNRESWFNGLSALLAGTCVSTWSCGYANNSITSMSIGSSPTDQVWPKPPEWNSRPTATMSSFLVDVMLLSTNVFDECWQIFRRSGEDLFQTKRPRHTSGPRENQERVSEKIYQVESKRRTIVKETRPFF